MGNTKKVGRAGRYGARYGIGIRKRLLKIEDKQRKFYNCPFCGFKKVRRKAAGLFSCRKCGATFTGGAYLPATLSGSIVQKMVTQKAFLPNLKELLEVRETTPASEAKGEISEPSEEKPAKGKENPKAERKKKENADI